MGFTHNYIKKYFESREVVLEALRQSKSFGTLDENLEALDKLDEIYFGKESVLPERERSVLLPKGYFYIASSDEVAESLGDNLYRIGDRMLVAIPVTDLDREDDLNADQILTLEEEPRGVGVNCNNYCGTLQTLEIVSVFSDEKLKELLKVAV